MSLISLLFTWNGRVRRSTYWKLAFLNALLMTAAITIDVVLMVRSGEPIRWYCAAGAGVFILWTTLVVSIKRSHDLGKTGWFVLLGPVPLLNIWPAILLAFGRGDRGINQFGPDPRGGFDSRECHHCGQLISLEARQCFACRKTVPTAAEMLAGLAGLASRAGVQHGRIPAGEVPAWIAAFASIGWHEPLGQQGQSALEVSTLGTGSTGEQVIWSTRIGTVNSRVVSVQVGEHDLSSAGILLVGTTTRLLVASRPGMLSAAVPYEDICQAERLRVSAEKRKYVLSRGSGPTTSLEVEYVQGETKYDQSVVEAFLRRVAIRKPQESHQLPDLPGIPEE